MILEALRSTLIVGTVLVNAVQLGRPVEPAAPTAPPETLPTPPLAREASPTPTTSLMTPAPTPIAPAPRLFDFKRVEAEFARLRRVPSGLASWYGTVFEDHLTATGEKFDSQKLTAASNVLPLNTRVRVTNLKNGLSVVVRVNDRGILRPGRIIDVSSGAAQKIGMLNTGVAPVHLDILAKSVRPKAS